MFSTVMRPPGCNAIRLGPSADLFGLTEATSNFCSPMRKTSTWARRRGAFKTPTAIGPAIAPTAAIPSTNRLATLKRVGAAMIHDRFDGASNPRRYSTTPAAIRSKPARSRMRYKPPVRCHGTTHPVAGAHAPRAAHQSTRPADETRTGLHAHLSCRNQIVVAADVEIRAPDRLRVVEVIVDPARPAMRRKPATPGSIEASDARTINRRRTRRASQSSIVISRPSARTASAADGRVSHSESIARNRSPNPPRWRWNERTASR